MIEVPLPGIPLFGASAERDARRRAVAAAPGPRRDALHVPRRQRPRQPVRRAHAHRATRTDFHSTRQRAEAKSFSETFPHTDCKTFPPQGRALRGRCVARIGGLAHQRHRLNLSSIGDDYSQLSQTQISSIQREGLTSQKHWLVSASTRPSEVQSSQCLDLFFRIQSVKTGRSSEHGRRPDTVTWDRAAPQRGVIKKRGTPWRGAELLLLLSLLLV